MRLRRQERRAGEGRALSRQSPCVSQFTCRSLINKAPPERSRADGGRLPSASWPAPLEYCHIFGPVPTCFPGQEKVNVMSFSDDLTTFGTSTFHMCLLLIVSAYIGLFFMSPHLLSGSGGTFLEQFSASVMFVFTANTLMRTLRGPTRPHASISRAGVCASSLLNPAFSPSP